MFATGKCGSLRERRIAISAHERVQKGPGFFCGDHWSKRSSIRVDSGRGVCNRVSRKITNKVVGSGKLENERRKIGDGRGTDGCCYRMREVFLFVRSIIVL